MSEIVSPNDPRVDAYIKQNNYQGRHPESFGVWAIQQYNDRLKIQVGCVQGTYREAVATMLSDGRAHWYAWGNGGVEYLEPKVRTYAEYMDSLRNAGKISAREAELENELRLLRQKRGDR